MKYLLILFSILIPLQTFLNAELTVYPDPPNAVSSGVYSLTVDGTPVKVSDYMDYHYAHFAFDSTIELEINASEDINTYKISPLSLGLKGQVAGSNLTFTMSQVPDTDCTPRHLVIKINDLEELIVLTDLPETDAPPSSGTGIFNVVTGYGADNTGATQTQPQIQNAINAAASFGSESQKGIVFIPPGLYMIHESLKLKSYVDLYLSPGAVLKSDEDESHYNTFDGTIEPALSIDYVHDVIIRGRGEIDASGLALMDPIGGQLTNQSREHPRRRNIRAQNSTNLVIKDIIAKDATGWSVEMLLSDNVEIQNIKVLNHRDVWYKIQNDGINNVSCDNMTVNQCFVITIDDAQCFKARYPQDGPMENGLFSNCVLWNSSAGVKCGMQNDHAMKNVVFRNIDIVHCRRAIAFDTKTGNPPAPISGAVFTDIRCEELEGNFSIPSTYVTEFYTETAQVSDITISNFTCMDSAPIKFSGNYPVSNVTFNNLVVSGKLVSSESDIVVNKKIPVTNLVFKANPLVKLTAIGGHKNSNFVVEASFTESVTGLQASDFTVINGAVQSISGGPELFWITVAPDGSQSVTISLPANAVLDNDSSGNLPSNVLEVPEIPANTVPNITSGALYLHLDADTIDLEDAAIVNSWTDSVSGYVFTGNATLQKEFLNDHSAVYFDGFDDKLTNTALESAPNAGNLTLFVVANFTTADNDSISDYMVSAQYPDGSTANRLRLLKRKDDAKYEARVGSGSSTSNVSADSQKHIFTIVSGRSGNSVDFMINDQVVGSSTSGTTQADLQALALGCYLNGDNQFADCSIAEILLYDSALTASDIYLIHQYIFEKYTEESPIVIPADFNNDTSVDLTDWGIMTDIWLLDSSSPAFNNEYDINSPPDGTINLLDLNVFISQWLIG